MLIKSGGRSGRGNEWLLFKKADDEALAEDEGSITDDLPTSVKTGRTLDQIATAGDAVWSSNGGLQARPAKKSQRRPTATASAKRSTKAVKSPARKNARQQRVLL